jgi:predicted deacylase
MKKIKSKLISSLLLLLTLVICFLSGLKFLSMQKKEEVFPTEGLTSRKMLSSYFQSLKNTWGDTEIYIYEGQEKGGNLLIQGGAHPNEPAGFITAVLLIENIQVTKGKIIIIPRANNSGFTHSDPQEGNPQRYSFETSVGRRSFRYGSRLTNPIHQWPDPTLYINPAGQKLSGTESRNLNRCYPGRKNGRLTEKVAYGIMGLFIKEKIDLAIDLHESAPEYPVINAILSHREWGDNTQAMAILLESANASHGRLKGKTSPALILEGKDKNYTKAAKLGRLFVPYGEEGIPLKLRVARHLAAIKSILSSLEELHPEKRIEIKNMPSSNEVRKKGLGPFLNPPN